MKVYAIMRIEEHWYEGRYTGLSATVACVLRSYPKAIDTRDRLLREKTNTWVNYLLRETEYDAEMPAMAGKMPSDKTEEEP